MTVLDRMILAQDQNGREPLKARKELQLKLGVYVPHRLYLDKVNELKGYVIRTATDKVTCRRMRVFKVFCF